jgi:hypothetical protein
MYFKAAQGVNGSSYRDGKKIMVKRDGRENKNTKLKAIPMARNGGRCHIKRETHFGVALISLPTAVASTPPRGLVVVIISNPFSVSYPNSSLAPYTHTHGLNTLVGLNGLRQENVQQTSSVNVCIAMEMTGGT